MKFLKMDSRYNFKVIDTEDYVSDYDAVKENVYGELEDATQFFPLPEGIYAWVNEDGSSLDMEPVLMYSIYYNGEEQTFPIVGNVVFTGQRNDTLAGLTNKQMREIMAMIEDMPKETTYWTDAPLDVLLVEM